MTCPCNDGGAFVLRLHENSRSMTPARRARISPRIAGKARWALAIVGAIVSTACGSESTPTSPDPTPADCSLSLAATPDLVPYLGGTVNVDVAIASGCAWEAKKDANWLSEPVPASGQGAARIEMRASVHVIFGISRETTVTVNGVPVVIRQRGYLPDCSDERSYTFIPKAATAPASGTTIRVALYFPEGCESWRVVSEAAWITVVNVNRICCLTSSQIDLAVAANVGDARIGVVRIAGLAFTVSQEAAAP